jgi:3'-phosphoadenosine 5'-phosphosulfate sulfotransferase (PAPS reductase)/FAD synthetase
MSTPDLTTYDWIVVNSSAGKDSQAMLDYVVELARKAKVLDRVVVVHADLGRVEWEGTSELAEEQANHYGLRFFKVSRPQGDLLEQIEARGMFPSSKARYCTSDHKRGQIQKVLVQLGRETGGPCRILNCLGLRADESSSRAKKATFEKNEAASTLTRTVDTWLPIHGWSVELVWARIYRSGVRYHRAYDLGMPRLSCCFCIFAPKSALMIAAQHNTALFGEYLRVEASIGHTFRVDLSLADVKKALDAGEGAGVVADWSM